MATYWSTLAYRSLFDNFRFFGRIEEVRAFDHGFAAEFLGALRTEDFARALAEGASAPLIKVLAFVADEMRPLRSGERRPTGGLRPDAARKAKPTPDEACALHLRARARAPASGRSPGRGGRRAALGRDTRAKRCRSPRTRPAAR